MLHDKMCGQPIQFSILVVNVFNLHFPGRYLLQGGRVLSVCSDFLNMAVPLFGKSQTSP